MKNRPVDEFLAHDLPDDALVVIVSKSTAELVVVHVGLVLLEPPESGHLLGVDELELAILLVRGPGDDVLEVLGSQELEQELPQRHVACHGPALADWGLALSNQLE